MKIKVFRPDNCEVASYNGTPPHVGDKIRTHYSTSMYSKKKDLFRVLAVTHDAEQETAIVLVSYSEGLTDF